MLILGIETSCDETAASVVKDGCNMLSNIVSSQVDIHHRYGGVVPELACRKHIENIYDVIDTSLDKAGVTIDMIDIIAVTVGPGLVGALLIGISTAKAIAFSKGIPLISVNHLEGHLVSIFLERKDVSFPYISLIISGGHTNIYLVNGFGLYKLLGQSLDDAAGEAFDKVSKMMGMGYPGGRIIEELAMKGDPKKISFPRAIISSPDFSFSGLKTAVRNIIYSDKGYSPEDIAAGFQEAVIDVVITKLINASRYTKVNRVVISGGVAANNTLRKEADIVLKEKGIECIFPSTDLCTDNAAMIACAGYYRYLHEMGKDSFLDFYGLDANTGLSI